MKGQEQMDDMENLPSWARLRVIRHRELKGVFAVIVTIEFLGGATLIIINRWQGVIPKSLVDTYTLIFCVFYVLSNVYLWWRGNWRTRFLLAQYERLLQINAQLKALEKEHPELVALKALLDLSSEQKEEVSSSHNFWISFGQNVFFLVLGIVVTYIMTSQHWLP